MRELATKPVRRVAQAVLIIMAVFISTIVFVVAVKPAEGIGAAQSARSGPSQTNGHRSFELDQRGLPEVEPPYQVGSLQATTSTISLINNAANSAPNINVWYGLNQSFGQIGNPQQWVNILGNVSGSVNSLSYRLNNKPKVDLEVGPDFRRLESAGDFNIDIDRALLSPGNNQVVITATDSQNNEDIEIVQVNYENNNVWPYTYTIDWSGVSDIQDVAQVVDGLWSVSAAGVKTEIRGYDRLVGIGDVFWDDYEVKVPITIHGANVGGEPGVGILMRWRGHTDIPIVCAQPKCGWKPHGNIGWFRFRSTGVNLEFNGPVASVPYPSFSFGTMYWFRIRVETLPNGSSFYRLRVWTGNNEPGSWNLEVVENSDDQPTGSFLLLAHRVDATFGDVEVVPLGNVPNYSLSVTTSGTGSVSLSPSGGTYSSGTVVTLTPILSPGWTFDSWGGPNAGDLSDNGDGTWSILMNSNKSVTATFTEGVTLNLNFVGQGSVEVVPSGDTYPIGTQVTLTPIPDPSWSFDSWSGPDAGELIYSSDGTWSITMNSDKSVTAIFIAQHQVLLPVIEKP